MAIDSDQLELISQALAAAGGVDARAVHVVAEEDVVVLRGAVATFEEASAASAIAQDHAAEVRSELRVDVNLREDGQTGASSEDRSAAQTVEGQLEDSDDLVDDVQDSLDENVPWDAPHEEVQVPTRAESRGLAGRGDEEEL